MRMYLFLLVLTIGVVVECDHRFMGTNVQRPLVYHHRLQFNAAVFKKRIENQFFSMPSVPSYAGRVIQGILIVDMTNSQASANVTQGGIGFNFVNIRMKSARGKKMDFDLYVYA